MPLGADAMNAWFDRLPRLWFDVGPRRVPAFRSLGIIGFHVAVLTAALTALRADVPLVSAVGLSAVAGLSFFGWGVLRRAVVGHESLVLMEYVWVAYGTVAGFAALSGLAVAPLLDVYSVAVAPFLAFGRFGCTTVGCCHGAPSTVGLRYGADHGLPARLVGRRLFPVQPIEALALLLIGAVGFALAADAPGSATVWFLVSYAVVRFGCERLRGDVRPTVAGLPVAKVMCLVQVAGAVVLAEAWLVAGGPGRAFVTGGAVLVAAAVAGLLLDRRRPANPLLAPDHLDEVWQRIVTADAPTERPSVTETARGLVIGVSVQPGGRHVSLSHPTTATLPVALALGGELAADRDGITHLFFRVGHAASAEPARPRPAPVPVPVPAQVPGAPDDYFVTPENSPVRVEGAAVLSSQ